MFFDRILTSLRRDKPRPHAPRFRLQAEADGWRVFDGDKALAHFHRESLDIWSFSPFEPDEIANPEAPGKVVDLHTVHNSFLNFGAQTWPPQWRGCMLDWTWVSKAGAELEAVVRVDGPDGEACRWRLTVAYDPAWARYRYRFAIEARKVEPDGFECLNLMMAGALEDRPEKRRWTHSLWENPDGQLRRVVHSNGLFHCTDYAGHLWRTRNLPYPQAWMAYAAHPTCNPAFLIHRTSVPMLGATCSQLFDEHIIWNRAGQDNLGTDGYFHYAAEIEFVNLPAKLAGELLSEAADPVRPAKWRHGRHALPFRMDAVNSFEEAVDPWAPEDCPIIEVPEAGGGRVEWATTGHTGTRSLKLKAVEASERVRVHPAGAVCKVRPHTRYRLSGWIRTAGVERFARLVLFSYEYTYNNTIETAASAGVGGTAEWTRVEVELDSGDEAYLMPVMELYGPGEAWSDDVMLEPAEPGRGCQG